MDRKTVLAMTLCFIIFMAWQKFIIEPGQQAQLAHQKQISAQQASHSGTPSPSKVETQSPLQHTASQTQVSTQLKLETGTGDTSISSGGSFFASWNLKSYKLELSPKATAVSMEAVTHQPHGVSLAFDDPHFAYLNQVQGQLSSTARGALWSYEDSKVKLTREFLADGNTPFVDVKVSLEFKDERPNYAFLSIVSQEIESDSEAQDRQLVYWTNQSLERVQVKKAASLQQISTPVKYIAATSRYFILALLAQGPLEAKGLLQPLPNEKHGASLVYPIIGKSLTIPFRVYFGPKELDLLRQVDVTLDHTVDFGWFTLFAYPLLKVLKWLYQFVNNYGVAIIILTLLLKILTYPLTYKSMKSMKRMAALQPQLQKIREKYKDDKEALNREMLTMMRTHGYNPMSGCLPMLIQMPIFFALYRVLYSSIELYHAPFMLWIQDLSSRDPYYVTPVLLSVTMFIQQKLTPNTATDPAQAKMMQMMPLVFGAFMITVPSGLTIYMLVNALASIAQQMILNKKLNVVPAR